MVAWAAFRTWGRANPFALSIITATGKTAAADAMTQLCIEQRPTLDRRRLALFTVFGCGYLGIVQYGLYVKAFGAWFPAAARFGEHPSLAARLADRAGLRDLVLQTLAGNFVHIPFAFFPAFYLTQEVIQHGGGASASRAMQTYRANAWADLVAAWRIWVPGHLLFFSTPMWCARWSALQLARRPRAISRARAPSMQGAAADQPRPVLRLLLRTLLHARLGGGADGRRRRAETVGRQQSAVRGGRHSEKKDGRPEP